MSRRWRVAAVAVAIALVAAGVMMQRAVAGAAVRELVINGGFEQPVVPHGTYRIFPSIPGWTEAGPRTCGIEIQNNVAGSPFEGNQYTELDSNCATEIDQDLTTVPGRVYRLSFAFSARPGRGPADNILQVWWNGRLIDTRQADGGGLKDNAWQVFHYRVRATGATTRLAFADAGVSDSYGTELDAVSVTCER
jgi:hypothetical protein